LHIVIMFNNLKYGIKNFYRLGKALWGFRWWDWSYLLAFIAEVLRYMAYNHRYRGNAEESAKIADKIDEAANLVEKLYLDDFFDYDYITNKYGEVKCEDNKIFYEKEDQYSKEELGNDLDRLYKEEDKNIKQVQKQLFRIISKYREWWD